MQHKKRIIKGIEEIFKGYEQDSELARILYGGDRYNSNMLRLFPGYVDRGGHYRGYYLSSGDGTTCSIVSTVGAGIPNSSSPRKATEGYLQYLCFKGVEPLIIASATERLDRNLGERVRETKRHYAKMGEIEE
ncbi:hypothetical protein HZC32_02065 [Candidatus Woesearchaeota archaeon]|nr:hypothetical protein [Candidatus Woesearchaeota archaeon]